MPLKNPFPKQHHTKLEEYIIKYLEIAFNKKHRNLEDILAKNAFKITEQLYKSILNDLSKNLNNQRSTFQQITSYESFSSPNLINNITSMMNTFLR